MLKNVIDIEDPTALLRYLRQHGQLASAENPTLHQLSGGVSNKTILVAREHGEAFVVKQALARLRVAAEWYSDPDRIHREALGLQTLAELAPAGSVTRLIFEDRDQHMLAMSAVPQPHVNWKEILLSGHVTPEYVAQFGQLLGIIHASAMERQSQLEPRFADRSFFVSLRVEPYYHAVAQKLPEAATFFANLIREMEQTRVTLVHGDYSPKNILVHQRRLILLDHEVIHWGDPAFDVGFALTHLISKAHHVPHARQAFLAAVHDFWDAYYNEVFSCSWRVGLEERAAHHTLACLLARVAGRSPLEYLADAERQCQQAAVLACMAQPPATIAALTQRFIEELDAHATH